MHRSPPSWTGDGSSLTSESSSALRAHLPLWLSRSEDRDIMGEPS